ncbi:MAG: UrcA family protein [Steroidobacteraceae bacterium]|nr:UrcA family protein [Steroidobacteraceae bacterium]
MKARTHALSRISLPQTMAAVLALSCVAGPALAGANDVDADVPRAYVSYADLDLSTEEGATRLYHRIVRAAETVCPKSHALNLRAASMTQQCIADAVERAVNEVNSPQLARLATTNGKRPSRG